MPRMMSGIARPIKFNVPQPLDRKNRESTSIPNSDRQEEGSNIPFHWHSQQDSVFSQATKARQEVVPAINTADASSHCVCIRRVVYARAGVVEGRIAIGTRTHPLRARFHGASSELFFLQKMRRKRHESRSTQMLCFCQQKWGKSNFAL